MGASWFANFKYRIKLRQKYKTQPEAFERVQKKDPADTITL